MNLDDYIRKFGYLMEILLTLHRVACAKYAKTA